jgi:hypothetical protein
MDLCDALELGDDFPAPVSVSTPYDLPEDLDDSDDDEETVD